MIRNVLEHIGGIASGPACALALFVLAFLGAIVTALRLRASDVARFSRLPLDNDGPVQQQGENGR